MSQSLTFNPSPSTIMHLDLNSCFASIEQQANPLLRGKPVAVAAYNSPGGCILAASVEAKKLGVKTGLRVREGKLLCPNLIVMGSDPWKYRDVHLKFRELLNNYTSKVTPKSIDEFVLDFAGAPSQRLGMHTIAKEIKQRIKREIGDWLTVSVGIAPNRFLAKTASNLHKPDGLDEINITNFESIYKSLSLTDLCGIKTRNAIRLNTGGIFTVWDFYSADVWQLRYAFSSILGYYWYSRLRGFEIDDVEFGRSSYGNSYALPKPFSKLEELAPILQKLVEKMTFRMRRAGYTARGVHLAILYKDRSFWHKGVTLPNYVFDSRDVYKEIYHLLVRCPYRNPVAQLAVSCFSLERADCVQEQLFDNVFKKKKLCKAVDDINDRWGNFVIAPATMLNTAHFCPDRVAFGGVKELEEFTLGE